jgi:Entner-Doudoroff aldolase
MNGFDKLLAGRVMVIIRGLAPADTVALAAQVWDLGIDAVEVPIGEPDQLPSLAATVRAGRERGLPVGAGTVITADQVTAAAVAGAAYTVAPGLDLAVREASLAAGMPHLPGVATATDLQRAWVAGCAWVKAFPARSLGPDWFRDIRGPFPRIQLVATGGIRAATAADYLTAGARVVAVGSAVAGPAELAQLAVLDHDA